MSTPFCTSNALPILSAPLCSSPNALILESREDTSSVPISTSPNALKIGSNFIENKIENPVKNSTQKLSNLVLFVIACFIMLILFVGINAEEYVGSSRHIGNAYSEFQYLERFAK